jgi:hypothetical protein
MASLLAMNYVIDGKNHPLNRKHKFVLTIL